MIDGVSESVYTVTCISDRWSQYIHVLVIDGVSESVYTVTCISDRWSQYIHVLVIDGVSESVSSDGHAVLI